MTGWKADGGSLCGESGSPRYFCGKEETEVPRVEAICAASSGSILSGTKVVLEKLIRSPVAIPNKILMY